MRARDLGAFLLGFATGALLLVYVLWRTAGLAPGHWLARTTGEISFGAVVTPIVVPTSVPTPKSSGAPLVAPPPLAAATPAPTLVASTPLAGFTLAGPALVMPVEGARTVDLHDNFDEKRGATRKHEAIDILAPRGTPVLAAVDGSIEKLFTSKQGGLTVYEFDAKREYCYYYAHLDRYAEGLREGQKMLRGDRLGYVGTTGDAPPDTPHLHFAIFRLGPEKRWWVGTPVNPYPLLLGTR